MNRKAPRGFTLIELLVAISVIGLLVAILLPALNRARAEGQRTVCVNNLKNMGIAFAVYCERYQNRYPPERAVTEKYGEEWTRSWADLIRTFMQLGEVGDRIELLNEYQKSDWLAHWKAFDCPGNHQVLSGEGRFDYGYNLNIRLLNRMTIKDDMIVAHDAKHFAPDPVNDETANPGIHSGMDNYLLADGSVTCSDSFRKNTADEAPWISMMD